MDHKSLVIQGAVLLLKQLSTGNILAFEGAGVEGMSQLWLAWSILKKGAPFGPVLYYGYAVDQPTDTFAAVFSRKILPREVRRDGNSFLSPALFIYDRKPNRAELSWACRGNQAFIGGQVIREDFFYQPKKVQQAFERFLGSSYPHKCLHWE